MNLLNPDSYMYTREVIDLFFTNSSLPLSTRSSRVIASIANFIEYVLSSNDDNIIYSDRSPVTDHYPVVHTHRIPIVEEADV